MTSLTRTSCPRDASCSRPLAGEVSAEAFINNLVIEVAGAEDNVVKFLPALIIDEETLHQGMKIIDKVIGELLAQKKAAKSGDTAA